MPDMICWEGDHFVFAALGAAMLLFYSVLVPAKLFHTVKSSAADGKWSEEELESHGWLLLKYKPSRWWFDFPLLYNKILFAVLSVLMDSDAQAWNLLYTLTALMTATLP